MSETVAGRLVHDLIGLSPETRAGGEPAFTLLGCEGDAMLLLGPTFADSIARACRRGKVPSFDYLLNQEESS